jgi:RND family efflux transporter MFP subunit
MKFKWKLWLVPLAAVLAFGFFKGGDIWGQKKEAPKDIHIQTVAVKTVDKVKKENTLSLTGNLEALNEATVSAKTAGRVSQVTVENGAAVAAGQPLVLLEDQDAVNQLAINQAALKKAEANLTTARINFKRSKELFESKVISKKDYEAAETGLMLAEADVNSAAASVAGAEESLRNTTIISPLSGVVVNRNVNVGQVVSPGAPLMLVDDISSVYAVVNIEQQDLAKIKPGLPAEISVDAFSDRKFAGVVEIINPAASKSARVFETKIKVDNQEGFLKPGMFAKVEIKTGEVEEVAAVPQNALLSKQGQFFVYIAEGDTAKRQQVEIGQILDQFVEIKSGLSVGDTVIATNVNKLKDQDRIKIAD